MKKKKQTKLEIRKTTIVQLGKLEKIKGGGRDAILTHRITDDNI